MEGKSAEVSNVKPVRESESAPSSLITSKPSPPFICQDHQSRGGGGIEMRHLNQRDGCEVMVQRWPIPAMTLNGLKEVVFI